MQKYLVKKIIFYKENKVCFKKSFIILIVNVIVLTTKEHTEISHSFSIFVENSWITGMVCLNGRCGGLLLPCSPLEELSPWFCQDCRTQFSWHQISNILEQTLLVSHLEKHGYFVNISDLVYSLINSLTRL